MIYGVKSKLYKRYIKTFDNYSDARVFALKQRQVWTNATMQIFEYDEPGSDRLVEELPPTKPTNYTKIRKKDIRGYYRVTVDPKKIYIPEREEESDLVSNCCAANFNPFGYEKYEGVWQEQCLNCGKLCEPLYLSGNDIENIRRCVAWNK